MTTHRGGLGAHSPVAATTDDGWSIQIFSTDEPATLHTARAFLGVALIGEAHDVQVSTDGVRHFLIVETRDDDALLHSVRLAAESAGPGIQLETVHAPLRHRRPTAEAA